MSGFREILFHFKGFSGTDICHSDAKMCSCKVKNFFSVVKNCFLKFPKFFTTKYLADQNFFL